MPRIEETIIFNIFNHTVVGLYLGEKTLQNVPHGRSAITAHIKQGINLGKRKGWCALSDFQSSITWHVKPPMEKIDLIKKQNSAGKFIYSAIKDGEILYESYPSNQEYVAMIIDKYDAVYKFGSVNSIGKGSSRLDYLNHSYPYIAIIAGIETQVAIPVKTPVSRYRFKLTSGTECDYHGISEQQARKAMKRKATKYFGEKAIDGAVLISARPWDALC